MTPPLARATNPAMPTAPPCAIVIFGASGDLAKRKLIPAIYEMALEKVLSDSTYVVGYSRSPMTDEQYRKVAREAVQQHARSKPIDEAVWKKVEQRFFYSQSEYGSPEDHAKLGLTCGRLDDCLAIECGRGFVLRIVRTRVLVEFITSHDRLLGVVANSVFGIGDDTPFK